MIQLVSTQQLRLGCCRVFNTAHAQDLWTRAIPKLEDSCNDCDRKMLFVFNSGDRRNKHIFFLRKYTHNINSRYIIFQPFHVLGSYNYAWAKWDDDIWVNTWDYEQSILFWTIIVPKLCVTVLIFSNLYTLKLCLRFPFPWSSPFPVAFLTTTRLYHYLKNRRNCNSTKPKCKCFQVNK